MKKIKIAFYKNSKTLFGKLIRFKQKYINKLPTRYARYSHTEIVVNDIAYSSSEVDGGVRAKNIEWNKDHWDFIELEISNKDYYKIKKFIKKNLGNSYNWIGIFLAQILKLNIKGKGDYFCSEFVSRALQEACYLCPYDSLFISPGQLAYILEGGDFIINN